MTGARLACDEPDCIDAATTGPDGTWCFVHSPPTLAGPAGVCWEYQAGELPIRLPVQCATCYPTLGRAEGTQGKGADEHS